MHDEVSDTENIRKNLAIERMIVEGCDILLDTSQTFVRQGESSSIRAEQIMFYTISSEKTALLARQISN